MPAGLDGNPDPIVTAPRSDLLARMGTEVAARKADRRPLLVAVDGIDGSGKSTFADELAQTMAATLAQPMAQTEAAPGLKLVRSSIDSFHHPRAVRWARGRRSPLGFYADSHDLEALCERLLDPLRDGIGATYRTEAFDEPNDEPLDAAVHEVSGDEVLIFDGIFLCRPELIDRWDMVIFLDGAARVELGRLGLVMESAPPGGDPLVAHVLDWAKKIDRYASGMRIYLDHDDPLDQAEFVIDNNDLADPRLLKP